MTFGPMGGSRERLDLGGVAGPEISAALPNGQRLLIRRKPGVLVWDKLPLGALMTARLERAASLLQADGSAPSPAAQSYRFELAQRPPERVIDATAFFNAVGGGYPHSIFAGTPSGGFGTGRSSGGLRTLHVTPSTQGAFVTAIDIPAWAAFSPVQEGSLVNTGKQVHQIPMPNLAGGGEALVEKTRNFLRMRWVGTAETGSRVFTGASSQNRIASAVWGDDAVNGIFRSLVPGSISLTLPTGTAFVVRDDGFGNLFGTDDSDNRAIGVVDYVSGAFFLVADTAQTGNVDGDFEHSIEYAPINANLEWDALVPQ